MSVLYDIVNFNSDASCLDSFHWLSILHGGERSQLFRWLRLFIDHEKPVSIGFTGATLADINAFNPEALKLLRNYPDIFQILSRPFAHDLPFFRTEKGFCLNLTLGQRTAKNLIGRFSQLYLPPEFMQTNRQTALLAEHGVKATFIMESRFKDRDRKRIPIEPYVLKGIPEGHLICIPVTGNLTNAYLKTIQRLDSTIWYKAISPNESSLIWRDGESSFLLPDGLEREKYWLLCSREVRRHLVVPDINKLLCYENGYPVHPFSAWLNEMSMLWFIQRVCQLENRVINSMSALDISRWLHCINSDILSSVEKDSPIVQLRAFNNDSIGTYCIQRSNRGLEGEALLEIADKGGMISGDHIWQKKAIIREKLVYELL